MIQTMQVNEGRLGGLTCASVTVALSLASQALALASEISGAPSAAMRLTEPHATFMFSPDRLASAVRSPEYMAPQETVLEFAASQEALARPDEFAKARSDLVRLKERLEISRELIREDNIPKQALHDHPFEAIVAVMNNCFKQMVEIRNSSKMTEDDEALFIAFAEALAVAKQNLRGINQAVRKPKVYKSEIDRDGLAMLARIGREASASFNA